ncbi:Protein kinase domain-containing protein [Entamoeba marina]
MLKNHLKFDDGTHVTVKLGSYGLHELGIDDSKIIKEAGVFLAPEVAGNGTYSEKSDVYSFGLLLWQLVYKCIFGHYSRPFDMLKKIAQIKLNLRPTIPQSTPPRMATLLRQCVLKEPESRPLCVEIERILVECEREYYSNRSLWDATIQDTDG